MDPYDRAIQRIEEMDRLLEAQQATIRILMVLSVVLLIPLVIGFGQAITEIIQRRRKQRNAP